MTERIYIVDFGDMFYGTLEQFKDTFGDMGDHEGVMRDVIEQMGYTFHALDGERIKFKEMTKEEGAQALRNQIAKATSEYFKLIDGGEFDNFDALDGER